VADARLYQLAADLGADVPFFLAPGPQLGEGDGTVLTALELPQTFTVFVLVPEGESKASTGDVYAEFDARGGSAGYDGRRGLLLEALGAGNLADLPPNDLAQSPHSEELRRLGAFRADVSGAGPAVYGLFLHRAEATAAERELRGLGRTWITVPTWYG
jgi:4-diphosphocytidyl-2-C-methyl-D-erythritol kinase